MDQRECLITLAVEQLDETLCTCSTVSVEVCVTIQNHFEEGLRWRVYGLDTLDGELESEETIE